MESRMSLRVGQRLGIAVMLGLATVDGFAQEPVPLAIRQREALNSGGLHAAAKITGSYVAVDRGPGAVIRTLDDLAKGSPLILLGTIVGAGRPHVGGTGKFVATEYDVKVIEVFKGHVSAGEVIAVDLRGGQVTFGDGTWARTETSEFSFRHPSPGQRTVFFLGPLAANEKPHPESADQSGRPKRILGVTLSYYIFTVDGSVVPAAEWPNDAKAECRADSPLVIWVRCQTPENFFQKLREAARSPMIAADATPAGHAPRAV